MSIRVGLIGCGGISRTHLSALKVLGYPEVAAVCDIIPERALERGREAGLPESKCYTDHISLLKDPDVNCVIVGTPHYHHAQAAIDAASYGKHVLTEKPMATSLEDADRMIEAAEKAGVILGVVFQHRFARSTATLKRLIDGGHFGRPLVAAAAVEWYREQSYYDHDAWRGTWAQEGGGSLINQAIHTLDRMVWLMGKPVSVSAEIGLLNHSIETEDITSLSIVFESGAIGSMVTTTCAWPHQPERLEIFCEKGSATVLGTDLTALNSMEPIPADSEPETPADAQESAAFVPGKPEYGKDHISQFHDFFSAVELGRSPLITGAEAKRTLSVVLAAYESAKTGKRVAI